MENINIQNNKKINFTDVNLSQIKTPEILEIYKINFEDFYLKKFKNRQIKWIDEHSYALMEMKFMKKNYQLIVSNYQMSILYFFNCNTLII